MKFAAKNEGEKGNSEQKVLSERQRKQNVAFITFKNATTNSA